MLFLTDQYLEMLLKLFYFALIIIANGFHQTSSAQSDTLRWKEGIILKAGDISVAKSAHTNYIDVHVNYAYWFETGYLKAPMPLIRADAILNKSTSSLVDSTAVTMLYAQILFDIQGYYCKLVKARALELGKMKGTQKELSIKMESLFFQANKEISQLKKDFDSDLQKGNPEEVLMLWSDKIHRLISEMPTVSIQTYGENLQIGLYIGFGKQFLSGNTKTYFTDPTSLNFGFEVDLKKSRFALDLNIGFNKTRSYFENKGVWQSGLRTNFAAGELTYGYKFPKNKLLFVPYFGIAVNEFTPRGNNDGDLRQLTGYCPVIGAELSRVFRRAEDETEKSSFFYKIKLSFSPTNFVNNLDGTQMNLRIAVGGDVARLKRKLAYQ